MIAVTVALAVALPVVVYLFLDHIKGLNATHAEQASEMLTRIQHPEIVRPELPSRRIEVTPTEPQDEMHLIGTISGGGTMGDDAST